MPSPTTLLAALAISLLAATPTPQTSAPILPFTLSKETTLITSPLLADGTPDYLAAINAKYSQGVTPETNGFLPFLKLRGPRLSNWGVTKDEDFDKILKLAGAPKPDPDAPAFQDFTTYQTAHNDSVPKTFFTQFSAAYSAPWTADQLPEFAAYLQAQAPFFTLAAEAANRPHFYVPFIAESAHFSSWQPISYTGMSNFANTWTARAMLRAGSHDFDGALADLTAIRRLGRHFANSGTTLAVLLGYIFETDATTALASLAAPGTLSEAQCDAMIKSINLPPLPTLAAGETAEHFVELDQFILIATKHKNAITEAMAQPNTPLSTIAIFMALSDHDINWNTFLNTIIEERNLEIAFLNAASPAQYAKQAEAFTARIAAWSNELKAPTYSFEKSPNESQAAFSARITHAVLQLRGTILIAQDKTRFSRAFRDDLLPTLLAAAKFKAKTGQWPETLNALVPAYLPAVPKDPYAPDSPITFRITDDHAIVSLVGPDQTPDTADDITLGAPTPPIAPPMPALP